MLSSTQSNYRLVRGKRLTANKGNKMECDSCLKELNDNLPEDTYYARRIKILAKDSHYCTECAKGIYADEKVKEYTELISKFSHFVNNCAYDHDGVDSDSLVKAFTQEHRYLQNEMIMFLHKIFEKLGKLSSNSAYIDARNEWAFNWCKKASDIY